MQQQVRQGIQVLRRAHEFLSGDKITSVYGPITSHVDALGQINTRLESHSVEQDSALRAFRGQTSAARSQAETLRVQLMRPIARKARSLFPDEPALLNALAMPRGRDYERLLAAAKAMSDVAEQHKDHFIAAGFPQNFVEVLRGGATALRGALDTRSAELGHRAAATAGMLEELLRGKELLRMLHDMVGPVLKDEATRREWATLIRFTRNAKLKPVAGTVPGDTPGPAPNEPPTGVPVTTTITPSPSAATEALAKAA